MYCYNSYYLVTDGLSQKHPGRVVDFPPDETALVGAAMGFSQVGLLTVLEIPYAKYLDCAADIFNELILLNWLSNGRQPCGMVVRLQGFDKGIFGGNFHTHNMLQIPPGLDVVCYSNGRDYVKGMR
jgi:2-oxoisovalerate dehydrogenase E1 component